MINVYARYNLGCMEGKAGNHNRAMKHYMLAAKAGGSKDSLDAVKVGFVNGIVTKNEYANTSHAHKEQQDERENDTREKARL